MVFELYVVRWMIDCRNQVFCPKKKKMYLNIIQVMQTIYSTLQRETTNRSLSQLNFKHSLQSALGVYVWIQCGSQVATVVSFVSHKPPSVAAAASVPREGEAETVWNPVECAVAYFRIAGAKLCRNRFNQTRLNAFDQLIFSRSWRRWSSSS